MIEELQLQLENDRKIIPDGVSIKSLIEFRPNSVKISAGFLNKKNLKGFTKSPNFLKGLLCNFSKSSEVFWKYPLKNFEMYIKMP